jgi:hypothetical protein
MEPLRREDHPELEEPFAPYAPAVWEPGKLG